MIARSAAGSPDGEDSCSFCLVEAISTRMHRDWRFEKPFDTLRIQWDPFFHMQVVLRRAARHQNIGAPGATTFHPSDDSPFYREKR